MIWMSQPMCGFASKVSGLIKVSFKESCWNQNQIDTQKKPPKKYKSSDYFYLFHPLHILAFFCLNLH
jgi:hypothetical protein